MNASGAEQEVASLAGQTVAAFCGIGNPTGFRRQLLDCGYMIGAFRELADHQAYTSSEIGSLLSWVDAQDVRAVVCTRKDLVKLPLDRFGAIPLWALNIELEVSTGEEALVALLEPLLRRARGKRWQLAISSSAFPRTQAYRVHSLVCSD